MIRVKPDTIFYTFCFLITQQNCSLLCANKELCRLHQHHTTDNEITNILLLHHNQVKHLPMFHQALLSSQEPSFQEALPFDDDPTTTPIKFAQYQIITIIIWITPVHLWTQRKSQFLVYLLSSTHHIQGLDDCVRWVKFQSVSLFWCANQIMLSWNYYRRNK